MIAVDAAFVAGLFPPKVSVAVASEPMFELPLLAGEPELIEDAVAKRRREFVGGRNAARAALSGLGFAPAPILRRNARAPAWPQGAVGSITHCGDFVCAVAARSSDFMSLGIDAETAQRMEPALAQLVCREDEFAHFAELAAVDGIGWATIAFSAKEAVHKCLFPLLGSVPDFLDVSLRFAIDVSRRSGQFHVDPGSSYTEPEARRLTGRWRATETMIISASYIGKFDADGR